MCFLVPILLLLLLFAALDGFLCKYIAALKVCSSIILPHNVVLPNEILLHKILINCISFISAPKQQFTAKLFMQSTNHSHCCRSLCWRKLYFQLQ